MEPMKLATILLLIGFVALGVFGALAMGGGHGEGLAGCIAAVATGSTCAAYVSQLAMADFHVGAFTVFSTAVVDNAALLALLLAAFAFLLAAGRPRDAGLAFAPYAYRPRSARNVAQSRQQLHSWLALFEKRDPDLF